MILVKKKKLYDSSSWRSLKRQRRFITDKLHKK